MRYLTFLLLFIFNLASGQCDYEYHYIGAPGAVYEDGFPTLPGSIIQIDYCTYNVPDDLIIINPFEEIKIIIGSDNQVGSIPPYYHGFTLFSYNNLLLDVVGNNLDTVPKNITCLTDDVLAGGTMRLIYTVPAGQCNFRWKVLGNKERQTVYHICITVLSEGEPVTVDTIEQHYCTRVMPSTILSDCEQITIIPIYSGIDTEMKVVQSDCYGSFEGSIEFEGYEEYNLYNLDTGIFNIVISNEYCNKRFNTTLSPLKLCNYYVPNVFSPNWDGNNDEFIFFTPSQLKYDMLVYDRWGELVFKGINLNSNVDGWNGTFRNKDCLPDVYVYQIRTDEIYLIGDITLIR